jgi:hypothetical protein
LAETHLKVGEVRPSENLEPAQWQEIDLLAPSDDDLERYAEEVRPPVEYYAE